MKIKKLFLTLLCCLGLMTIKAQHTALGSIINGKNTLLIDVRTPEEFSEGSAKGAINIPLDQIEQHLGDLPKDKNLVLFCRSGRRAEKAQNVLNQHHYKLLYNGGSWSTVKSLQKMNILEQLQFNAEKPSVAIIKKNDHIKYFAVGLGKNTLMKKHITAVPATLVMVKGEVEFHINGETLHLKVGDTYEIPVNVEHEVIGVTNENVFLITQEL